MELVKVPLLPAGAELVDSGRLVFLPAGMVEAAYCETWRHAGTLYLVVSERDTAVHTVRSKPIQLERGCYRVRETEKHGVLV